MLVELVIYNLVHPGRTMPGKESNFHSRKERKNYFKGASDPASDTRDVSGLPMNPALDPNTPLPTQQPSAMSASSAPDQNKKRAKLTASDKEAKRLEKEAKEKEKAEQKVKREEEKTRKEQEREEERICKEQEKQAKQAEKDKKRLEKEEQSRLREEEKKKKEEEKNKKNKPNLPNDGSTPSPIRGSLSPANSRRSSVTSMYDTDGLARDRSVSATPSKPKLSEYDRRFPSFFLQSHTTLAPCNRFERDEEGLQYAQKGLDESLASETAYTDGPAPFNPKAMLHVSPYKRRKLNTSQPSVKQAVDQLNGTYHEPIDLTDSSRPESSRQPLDLLKSVSIRFFKFAEDVRPPYIGTYTRLQNPSAARKLCRNPFGRELPSTDYDYDSEAEWEEPGEGEDLDSEGEEEVESEDGDDMEGFLDDEDTAEGMKMLQKRRLLSGDLEPTSTGVCWEDTDNHPILPELRQYRLEVILGRRLEREA
ncbi:MAG: hypothetical protein LQ343_002934 [Gyalolechia ehrenbergii]|nr:MAG: hypothetical protein LQ343_002934 [Gyalolechia ehrenbergii]